MRNVKRIITTTRLCWGISAPEAALALDGRNAGGEGSREVQGAGVGDGSTRAVCGDLRGCEHRADALAYGLKAFAKPRFGRWAGQGLGVRPPMRGETPLSREEVLHGIEHDILDPLPTRRILKPIGAWERANVRLMAKAQPFDGLMA